jgi:hypothetical protein
MITCTVCGKENDDLSVVCSACKSFLQSRVDALDLFTTLGGLIENPRSSLKKIVLAKYKNYSLILSALFGVSLVFEIAWLKDAGDKVASLLPIVGAAFIGGPIAGMIVVFVVSVALQQTTRVLGGHAARKNLFAAIAYATSPMVIALVVVIPLQLAVFGKEFFGTNPPPSLVRPTEYYLLLALKALAACWTVYLVIEAAMAGNAFERKRFVPVAFIVFGIIGLGIVGVGQLKFL